MAAKLGLVNICRLLLTNGANPSIMNHMRNKPIDLATPPVAKVLEEEQPVSGDSDIESELLEAAKNGDLPAIKVCSANYLKVVFITIIFAVPASSSSNLTCYIVKH